MRNPIHEIRLFLGLPLNMRVLLLTNFIYAFTGPIVGIFIGTYLMRQTANDVKAPVVYQLMLYAGIPLTFLVNGFLLKRMPVAWLYSMGMLISGGSIWWMMSLKQLSLGGIAVAGLFMGMATGFYWANRDFLAISSTNDGNRNYYYGLEAFLGTSVGMVMPVAVGSFIHWYAGTAQTPVAAYRILAVCVFVISLVASWMVNRGEFKNPPATRFVFFRFHPLWLRLQILAAVKGLSSGYTVMVPAMLSMLFLAGKEGTLGFIQSAGAVLTAVMMYFIGRLAKPRHRIPMYAIGMILYAIGTIPNALFYDRTSAMWFMICLMFAGPLPDMADTTVQMLTIDTVSAIEGRSMYAYILNREFGYFVGRASGLIIFLVLAYGISNVFALRYSLLLVGIVQLLTIWIIRSLVKGCAAYATTAGLAKEEVELAVEMAEPM